MKKIILIALAITSFSANAVVTENGAPGGAAIDAGAFCTDPAGGNAIIVATGGVTDTVSFTQAGTISDTDVAVGITHTWRGDTVMDVSYDGTTVFLINNLGNVSSLDFGATFDDDAATLCTDASQCGLGGACNAACQPTTPLAAFDAKVANLGVWTMRICDKYSASDTGTFDSWSVTLDGDGGLPVELLNFEIN